MATWRYEISLLVLKKYFTRLLRSLMKYFPTLEEKFRISTRPCNILYLCFHNHRQISASLIHFIKVFNKVLSRGQKLWSRRWRKKLVPTAWVSRGSSGLPPPPHPPEKLCNLDLLKCIPSILEQKLECLNRTQISLNLKGFFVQRQSMNTRFFFFNFLLANSYEPLVVSVLNHLHTVSPVVVVFFLQWLAYVDLRMFLMLL